MVFDMCLKPTFWLLILCTKVLLNGKVFRILSVLEINPTWVKIPYNIFLYCLIVQSREGEKVRKIKGKQNNVPSGYMVYKLPTVPSYKISSSYCVIENCVNTYMYNNNKQMSARDFYSVWVIEMNLNIFNCNRFLNLSTKIHNRNLSYSSICCVV